MRRAARLSASSVLWAHTRRETAQRASASAYYAVPGPILLSLVQSCALPAVLERSHSQLGLTVHLIAWHVVLERSPTPQDRHPATRARSEPSPQLRAQRAPCAGRARPPCWSRRVRVRLALPALTRPLQATDAQIATPEAILRTTRRNVFLALQERSQLKPAPPAQHPASSAL